MRGITAVVESALLRAARGVSGFSYPASWERLEIDENRSLWAAYTPEYEPSPSLRGDITADFAIIGGGFTGVSAAYHLSRRFPDKHIVLLEARSLANGASGRNGGMMLNWVYGVGPMPDEMTRRVYTATNNTIDAIEATIEAHNLDVSYRRDGCLQVFTDPARADEAAAEAARLNALGIPVRFLDAAAARRKIELHSIHGALLDPNEGQLNGAQFVRGLRPVLVSQGVSIYENTPVLKVVEGPQVTLTTPDGSVRAGAILLATNGYTGKLGYFRKAYFPLHSHVFATAPAPAERLAALGWRESAGFSDDLNRLSYATQTREGHVVFGGGSNISYAYLFNNRTAFPGTPTRAQAAFADMERTFDRYLPGAGQLPIAHRWTGTLAITLRRNCSIGIRGEHKNVYYAFGYSGHGVTAANMAGKIIADLYSGDDAPWRDLPFVHADFAPIPLEPFRWLGYQLMTRTTGRSPREPFR